MKQPGALSLPRSDGKPTDAIEGPPGPSLLFVAILSIAELVSWGTLYYTFAVVSGPIERDLGWTKATINGAWSIGLLVAGLAAVPVGALLDRLGGRIVMSVGSLLGAGSLVLWSNTTQIPMLYVACAGLGVAMAASLYEAGFAVLMRRFPLSYGIQITRMTLVGGLAPTIIVPVTVWLVSSLGWRAALLALAALMLTTSLPVHAFALRDTRKDDEDASLKRRADGLSSNAALRRALINPAFWALLVTFTIHATLVSAIVFHIIPLLTERGYSASTITIAYTLIGPAQVGGRIGLMALRGHFKSRTIGLVTVSTLPMIFAMLIVLPSTNLTAFLVLIMYGVSNGLITIVKGTSVPDFLGPDGYGAINGMVALVTKTCSAGAPFAVALAWRATHSYDPIVWGLFGLALLAVLSFAFAIGASKLTKAG